MFFWATWRVFVNTDCSFRVFCTVMSVITYGRHTQTCWQIILNKSAKITKRPKRFSTDCCWQIYSEWKCLTIPSQFPKSLLIIHPRSVLMCACLSPFKRNSISIMKFLIFWLVAVKTNWIYRYVSKSWVCFTIWNITVACSIHCILNDIKPCSLQYIDISIAVIVVITGKLATRSELKWIIP